MPTRSTLSLKELIYGKLSGDATLESLLGGAGRVRHANPQQLSEYPLVVYSIIEELDNPYDIDQPSNVAQTRLLIEAFSNDTDSAEADAIEDRVYALLHGQRLSNSGVQMYSSYRVSKTPIFETEAEVWKIESAYDLYNARIT